MAKRESLNGKPYAGNPHVRFDEGEVASCTAAIETEGRNSPSIAQGLPSLRRVHCRRQPKAMTRPQVASRSEVARGLRAMRSAPTLPLSPFLPCDTQLFRIPAMAIAATNHDKEKHHDKKRYS